MGLDNNDFSNKTRARMGPGKGNGMSIVITKAEIDELCQLTDGDEPDTEWVLSRAKDTDNAHDGPGLYACLNDYPDEGSINLTPTTPDTGKEGGQDE